MKSLDLEKSVAAALVASLPYPRSAVKLSNGESKSAGQMTRQNARPKWVRDVVEVEVRYDAAGQSIGDCVEPAGFAEQVGRFQR